MVLKPLPLPTAPPARIGSTPPWFNANIDQYEHLEMIFFFYNEDMGIVAGNDLPERKEAVRTWLKRF